MGLDLAQLDPVATQLDLLVGATEELDLAVGKVAPKVTGVIQPLARDWVVHETRCGFGVIVQVAKRQSVPRNEELSRHVHRARREVRLDNVKALVPQRGAIWDRNPRGVALVDGVENRPNRSLGRAAKTEQARTRHGSCQPSRKLDRNPVTTQHEHAQTAKQRRWPRHRRP